MATLKGSITPSEVREIRLSLGYTQDEFERIIGVAKPTCSRWENGSASVGRTAERLMRVIAKYPCVAKYLAGL